MAIKIATPKGIPSQALPTDVAPDVSIIQEHYPNIGNRITMLWGSIQLNKYLNQLIIDDRGDRQGFPAPVVSALLRIYQFHTSLIPETIVTGGIWDDPK